MYSKISSYDAEWRRTGLQRTLIVLKAIFAENTFKRKIQELMNEDHCGNKNMTENMKLRVRQH